MPLACQVGQAWSRQMPTLGTDTCYPEHRNWSLAMESISTWPRVTKGLWGRACNNQGRGSMQAQGCWHVTLVL